MTDQEAFVAYLTGLVVAYRRPAVDHHALAAHMKTLLDVAKPRFRLMVASRATVDSLQRQIQTGRAMGTDGMPKLPYARDLLALKKQMTPALRQYYVHPDVHETTARLLRQIMALMTPDTATVAKKDLALNKALAVMPDRTMRIWFSPPAESRHDQQHALGEATMLVKRMVRRNDSRLAPTETKQAKEDHPDTYRRYLEVRRNVMSAVSDHVRDAAREAGGPVAVTTLLKSFREAGISYHPYAPLKGLHVGEDGKLFTGKPHRVLTKTAPAPGSKVVMNPTYDPKTNNTYVFKFQVPGTKRGEDEYSAAYTLDYVRGRKDARFDLVTRAAKEMPALRPKWLRDLKSRDRRVQMLACMTEMLYGQAMRVGGEKNNVDGKTTYGLSTLLVGHVKIRNGTAIVTYPGKDAIQQKHVLRADDKILPETAQVIQIMQRAVVGKTPSQPLWTDAQGNPIRAADVRAYMKGHDLPIGPHKFRHLAGSAEMMKQLEKLKIPRGASQQSVEKLVKQAAIHVGALLGHMSGDKITPATAIRSYISPGVLAEFFKEKGLRIPAWVPMSGRGGSKDEDD